MPSTDAGTGWTNPSVLRLANGADPLEVAGQLAKQVTAAAVTEGLDGPPFDPFALAELLGLSLRARADVSDARIRADTVGVRSTPRSPLREFIGSSAPLVVEYNPTRPRGRLRYSVAHEIAHGLFPDVADTVRHRTSTGALPGYAVDDAWQLELLCNLIAAELLMPEEAVSGLIDVDPDIDFIMEQRRRFDVSTEALLRRLTTVSDRELGLVAASRIQDRPESELTVEYFVPSVRFAPRIRQRVHVPVTSVLSNCLAVGQTSRGAESIDGQALRVQAVGIPPYPGRVLPRVLALVEPESAAQPEQRFERRTGDVSELDNSADPVLIAHVVTDSARTWGRRGVAASLTRRFPDAARAFRSWAIADPDNLTLGNVHFAALQVGEKEIFLASIVAQRGYGPGVSTRLDYGALRQGLYAVAQYGAKRGVAIHLPRIGAGQAGGRWDEIGKAIEGTLVKAGLRVVVYTMPSQPTERDV
ncbi:hypothetical protein DMH03_13575 [Amycolatopsis sp. WAC 01376]|uniref:ImmA/IrrE family metallo-endopeptidase n=1 Tax=Amycolatopsis sp. WAC 01376 TaxID=2203195 RepID=UPI000F7A1E93|nr:ImmA/IrrE family metallo-endopeptidase [Amycolatopsis sp. WAC 01376]RSM63061.1 hypothetical protein DMH03_13575 [Amycolatopsis sp. WAC 01376]